MIEQIEDLPIKRAKLITLKQFQDGRGKYLETFDSREYEKILPLGQEFVQDDYSRSVQRTLRGLHGDNHTWKLIQCIYGAINFVMFDMTNHQTYEIRLSDLFPQQVLVPPQCANGHLCLSPECIFYYKQSTHYGDFNQFTVKWNDPRVTATWAGIINLKIEPILSDRDAMGPFHDFGGLS